MRLIIICGLLFLRYYPINAQYEAILNDPDVIWAAEIDLVFWIEPEGILPDSVYASHNRGVPLKLLNTAAMPNDASKTLFRNKLFQLLYDDTRPVYAHPDSIRALTAVERYPIIHKKDTITVTDPATLIKHNQLIINDLDADLIQRIKVRQLLFYNNRTDEFGMYTTHFAPFIKRYFDRDVDQGHYEFIPFWFKMPPYNAKKMRKKINLNDPNITWARRLTTGDNMPALDAAHLRPLKNIKQPMMQPFLDRVQFDPDFEVHAGYDWSVLPLKERAHLIFHRDTVITFNPENYEAMAVLVDQKITGADAMQIRLAQDWYWDERQRFPIFRLYAFSPLQEIKDDAGNHLHYWPLFWRVVAH